MSNEKPRNPSAFPQSKKAGEVSFTEGGMTLRDYFAAKVAARCLRDALKQAEKSDCAADPYAQAARYAYSVADAMLAEREREE